MEVIKCRKHILIMANRSIAKSQELTYSYNFAEEGEKLPCHCGAENCNGWLN